MRVELDHRTEASIKAYDTHARAYQEALRKHRPTNDVRRFGALAAEDALVLDLGCGPANDLRLLRDQRLHPVGVDLSLGVLREARMLLPRHPLVLAPFDDLPFKPAAFGGIWMSGAFTHLPRGHWSEYFTAVLRYLDTGPVYFSCLRGQADLEPVEDEVLGEVFASAASEDDILQMFTANGLTDIQVELRPDPLLDRRRPWVVALARRTTR